MIFVRVCIGGVIVLLCAVKNVYMTVIHALIVQNVRLVELTLLLENSMESIDVSQLMDTMMMGLVM